MWLLDRQIFKQVQKAIEGGIYSNVDKLAEFEASNAKEISASDGSDILSRAGKIAQININGILSRKRSFWSWFLGLGSTTYAEIMEAIAEAEFDEAIESIELLIDSPGGQFAGLFDTIAAIQAAKKPITSIVGDMAASAAYAIAVQAEKIIATNQATMLGSVGVVQTFYIYDDEIDVTSTNAPRKRPDVTTKKGLAMAKEELDALHEIFVESIASGRKTTVNKVNANFGQGGIVLAREALKRGMIDSIKLDSSTINVNAVVRDGGKMEIKSMNLEEFKAEHPTVYKEAVAIGAAHEKDRVESHLVMAKPSGDFTIAHKAIADGSVMTQTLQAEYMTAALNHKNIDDRQEDDEEASAADNIVDDKTTAEDESDAVANQVAKNLGSTAPADKEEV